MAVSDVTICSSASLMLGGKPISSFTDNNDRARLAAGLYPMVRDYVLRRHPWNCATKRVSLAPDVDTPPFDWAFQFALPGDCMRVLSVGEDGAEVDFKVESGKLLCDEPEALVRYIWRNEEPSTWDAMLVWGMTMAMKAVMAYPITQSTSLEQLVEDALKDTMKQARAADGQEQTPDTLGDSPLMLSRFGSNWWRR